MKIISMILAALMFLPVLASAVPDSVTAGQYNISFDLGIPREAYSAEISNEYAPESNCQIVIKNTLTNSTAHVTVSEFPEDHFFTPSQLTSLAKSTVSDLSPNHDAQATNLRVDGVIGAFASGKTYGGYDNYLTIYSPNPRLIVVITSFHPYDELLKTLHVAKAS